MFAICASHHGRRPYILNRMNFKSICGDEAGFVNLLGYALVGQHEDAFLVACNFVRPEVTPILLNFAMDLALNLRLIALNIGIVQGSAFALQTLALSSRSVFAGQFQVKKILLFIGSDLSANINFEPQITCSAKANDLPEFNRKA